MTESLSGVVVIAGGAYMTCYTAQILGGFPHPDSDGFLENREPRRLVLSENSRAAWTLYSTARAVRDGRIDKVLWIARRPSSILDDGLLMLSVLVLKDKEVRTAMMDMLNCDELASIDLSKALTEEQHNKLISLSRKSSQGRYYKIIISSFYGSCLLNRVHALGAAKQ
jgi:hypothetical protein